MILTQSKGGRFHIKPAGQPVSVIVDLRDHAWQGEATIAVILPHDKVEFVSSATGRASGVTAFSKEAQDFIAAWNATATS